MKIRLLTDIAGPDSFHGMGEEVELDDATSVRLINTKQAEAVRTPAPKRERSTSKKARRRRRATTSEDDE
ncbi:hypothetical protein LCGC14_2067790 [marine sediment metagenome]|uniref:Uncharacterized protein n=1 Tax=marine sediment metagenome TaxID=412755 RepID=A0A0F9F6M9_9ZZZZ